MAKAKISCTIDDETLKALDAYCKKTGAGRSKPTNMALIQFLRERGVLK